MEFVFRSEKRRVASFTVSGRLEVNGSGGIENPSRKAWKSKLFSNHVEGASTAFEGNLAPTEVPAYRYLGIA